MLPDFGMLIDYILLFGIPDLAFPTIFSLLAQNLMLFRSRYSMRGFKNFHILVVAKYLNYHTVFKEDIFLTFSQFRWSSVLIIVVIKQTLGLGSKLSFINQMSTNEKYAKVVINQY